MLFENSVTDHSRSSKHGRFGHVIDQRRNVTRSLVEKNTFQLILDFMDIYLINVNPDEFPKCLKTTI